ncbi:hypothetical protein [Massilia sp. DD77]|uniref:hypothetical protein n=1 Tax=Massilia sp. DD77 TaxID=3109349 RepID=UPI0030003944
MYSGVQESVTKNVPGKASPAARKPERYPVYREDLQRRWAHFVVAEAVAMNESVLP